MLQNKYTIGVIGLGFVGGAVMSFFNNEKFTVFGYDKYKSSRPKEAMKSCDILFICVPTPYKNGSIDLSAIEETFEWIPENKLVIIKSTVPPGTTDHYAEKYNGHVFFNPEFLDSSKAEYDFAYPERQIIGYSQKFQHRNVVDDANIILDLMDLLPKAHMSFKMPAKSAECVKYMGNTFMAVKNVFANMWYDYCDSQGINYDMVREAVGADSRIGFVHMEPVHKGSRGAAGSCLPKDLAASEDFFNKAEVPALLLNATRICNDKRLKEHKKFNFGGMYEL